MLKLLKIKNIALIESLEIEFEQGLNVLTGETGAGKSIIIDSLNFVLGARTDKTLIRNGENTAKVEALFDISNNTKVFEILNKFEIEFCDEILITRSMSVDGRGDIKVNGNPLTAGMLKEITCNLVDIYGQQEQVGLMNVNNQLALLDGYCGNELKNLKLLYVENLKEYKKIKTEMQNFGGDKESAEREKDYLIFAINEIENENISVEEENELKEKLQVLNNLEKISTNVSNLENSLGAVTQYLSNVCSNAMNISGFDVSFKDVCERLNSCKIELDDLAETVSDYSSNLSYNENEFDKIDAKLEQYKRLERKYGGSVEAVLNSLDKMKSQLDKLENSEKYLYKLEKRKQELLQIVFEQSDNINNIRRQFAEKLSLELKNNLALLGMKNASISFDFVNQEKEENNLSYNGLGQVEMMFSANLGEIEKPLSKVASGGELSRLMLAIKSLVADIDNIDCMIFDEIDTGISGQMAQAVAEKIAKISKFHQVIVVTHTLQIASMADSHYLIKKQENENKTTSSVSKMSKEERINELSRFIASDGSTELSKQIIIELLEKQNKLKSSLK